jgi:isocitrate dehydrogenase (NAD+)
MMLKHLKFNTFANRLEAAIFSTLKDGVKTRDIGGSASTTQVLDSICGKLEGEKKAQQAAKKGKGVSKAV